MNVNLSHNHDNQQNPFHPLGVNTDVAMLCVGYDCVYGSDQVGSHFTIRNSLTKLDVYFSHWNDSKLIKLLQQTFGNLITSLTFTSVFHRICIDLVDRAKLMKEFTIY